LPAVYVDHIAGEQLLVGIMGHCPLPFIARLRRRDVLVKDARLASAASASNRGQSSSPWPVALGSNARQCARIRIELCADVCRASPSPPAGTTRQRLRSSPICRARPRILPRAWPEHEASLAR